MGRALPDLEGKPILVELRPCLTAHRGRLLSGETRGRPVHGASFLRARRIVLDRELEQDPKEFERILIHEIFHFVWVRLGNPRRHSFEALLAAERSRGELGFSAEALKAGLTERDPARRTKRWRSYACESFCDTAAWYYSSARCHDEWTLAPRFVKRRAVWFRESFDGAMASI